MDAYSYANTETSVLGLQNYAEAYRSLIDEADAWVGAGGGRSGKGGAVDKSKFTSSHMHEVLNNAPLQQPLTNSERARVLMLLFDKFAPELNLDDVLLLILGKLREIFNVEQVRFYFPIDIKNQRMTLFMVDDEIQVSCNRAMCVCPRYLANPLSSSGFSLPCPISLRRALSPSPTQEPSDRVVRSRGAGGGRGGER